MLALNINKVLVFMKKYRVVILFTIIIVTLFDFARYNMNGFLDNEKYFNVTFEKTPKTSLGEIVKNTEIKQSVFCYENNLSGLNIFFSTFNRVNKSNLIVEIQNSRNLNVVRKVAINLKNLKDNSYFTVKFDPILNSKFKNYYICLKSPNSVAGNAVTTWMGENSRFFVMINNKRINGSMVFDLIYRKSINLKQVLFSNVFFLLLNCFLIKFFTFLRS